VIVHLMTNVKDRMVTTKCGRVMTFVVGEAVGWASAITCPDCRARMEAPDAR
jgi:hypothetical protein